MVSSKVCLVIFVFLLLTTWILLFFHAYKRQKLIRDVAELFKKSDIREEWLRSGKGLNKLICNIRRVKIIRRNSEILPDNIKENLRQLTILSKTSIAAIIVVIAFSLLASAFCN